MEENQMNALTNMLQKQLNISPTDTFTDIVRKKAERVGDKVYLTYVRDFDKGIDEKYTYRDMYTQSNRLANGFTKLGLNSGDGISVYQINSPEFLFTLFAAWKMGCYVVLVNTGLKGDGLQYIVDHSDSNTFLTHWSLLDNYLKIRDELPKIKNVLVDMNEAPADFNLPEGILSLQSVMEAPDDDVEVEIDPNNMSILIYTSGTTGLPKATTFFYGKMLNAGSLTFSALIAYGLGKAGDVLYTCLPLFHGNALQLCSMPGYMAEFPVILSKRFSASRFWDIIRKYGVTNFNLLGSMPQYLLKQPKHPNDKDNKVWRVNSAACPKELVKDFEERFGLKIYEAYGAVDGGGFSLGTGGAPDAPVGSMGKTSGNVVGEIMDDEGNILEPNTPGELVFLVKEEEKEERKVSYYKNEEASESRIQKAPDGRLWFHTGDVATKDENGWFFFVDRKKDSIRRRGENIAAWSVERVINRHDKVLESAAYGIKGQQVGEDYAEDEVMVAVVLKPGETMEPEELLDFVQDKLAHFQIPRFVEFVESLPKSEVHRIMKRFLKDKGVTDTTYDREKAGYELKK
ncbi:MAG: AMP-binding protein [Candidatus Lokiarchaeota archaeon]|nr:AMP-binding protein [Candidatus Lokiarchaeota archaeon]